MVEYGILKECRLKMILNKLEKKTIKKIKIKWKI